MKLLRKNDFVSLVLVVNEFVDQTLVLHLLW